MSDDTETLAEVVLAAHHWGDDTAQLGHHAVQCGCGWKDYEPSANIYALRSRHDRHRAEALAARIVQAREAAEFKVASSHHFHGNDCLCGFSSARSRSRTEHILAELRALTDTAGGPT